MKKLLFSTIILIMILSCNKTASASSDDEIVATWRGGQITLKEFEDFALYYAFEDSATAVDSSFDERRKILKDMIKYKLVEKLADSLRLDTMKVMKESYKRKLGGVAYKHYLFPDSVRRKVFSDYEIMDYYNNLKLQGAQVGSFEREKQKIINELTKKYKHKYDSIYNNFINFLYDKYAVQIDNPEIAEFTDKFNLLLKEDIPVKEGFGRFEGSKSLANYNNDNVTVEETLNYFSKINKNTYPAIKESDVYNFIFITYQNDLLLTAANDLGYTKKPEVIKIVKEGMILDYLDYFTDSFFNNPDKMKRWQNELFNYYNTTIMHSNLESSFFRSKDIRK
ncbi:MAG: hypothetical protein JXN63_05550 [Candidatus Delongbacteria bacterium]|nr:hypothetical protein [Candidatus Delongbacteria bacterium]